MVSALHHLPARRPKPLGDMEQVEIDQHNVQDYICSQINAGLGNQMFYYAAGFAQAKRLGVDLVLGVKSASKLAHTEFGLDIFPISAKVWRIETRNTAPKLIRLLQRKPKVDVLINHWPGPHVLHLEYPYNPAIETIAPGSYLAGNFSSERYFGDVSEEIREEFSLAYLYPELDAGLLSDMEKRPTVSVHIRRGDYLNDPENLKNFGLLDDDHYNRARQLMERLVPDCQFLILSDDPEAAKALTNGWPRRLFPKPQDRARDLALMTLCDHHIVANSTFSWWGAWLNPSPDKHVIAPRRWFSREHMQNNYTGDICPDGWILI